MRDARRVGGGVVVNRPGALERLEANKQEFVEEFIGRPEFLERYPFIRPDEAANFVDSLDANSGRVLSPAERAALIAEYTGGHYFLLTSKSSPYASAFVLMVEAGVEIKILLAMLCPLLPRQPCFTSEE